MGTKAKIFAALLLAMFIGHLSDASLFPHSHFVDGRVIAHSHPHAGTKDSPGHEHCGSQLVMIALLSTTVLVPGLATLPDAPVSSSVCPYVILHEDFKPRHEERHNYLRGPPSVPAIS